MIKVYCNFIPKNLKEELPLDMSNYILLLKISNLLDLLSLSLAFSQFFLLEEEPWVRLSASLSHSFPGNMGLFSGNSKKK